jgi:FkbM family methyltransferase
MCVLALGSGMLDIGASYGWYTKFAANLVDPQAPKIALEAHPEVATCLERSVWGLPGVRVLNVAATARPGESLAFTVRGVVASVRQ